MRNLLEISKSGLRSAERSLSVTSNNIINADTPGYTRQRIEKSPTGMQMSGHNAGLGVNVDGITRLRNEMNDVLMNQKQQDMAYMEGKATVFEQLEAVMVTDSGNDLDMNISRLLDGFSELSSNPQDVSVRNSLLSDAQQLTEKFKDIDRNLERVSELTKDSAIKTIDNINSILKEVHSLNQSIEQGEGSGQSDNASLDKRVAKLDELSQLVDFESQLNENGGVQIRIEGVSVLNGRGAKTLRPEIDDINKQFLLRAESGKTIDPTGGKLGAELEMYTEKISGISGQLNELASSMVEEINTIHRNGFGLNDDTNRNFFDPTGTDAANINVNAALLLDPDNIAASGAIGEAGNGDVAAQIAELRNDKTVDGRKFSDFAIGLISEPGSELSGLRSQIEAREAEVNMLKTQQEREAGVNIDEELSLMIQYQNAYQGAAKVMSATQNMYDTLISIV